MAGGGPDAEPPGRGLPRSLLIAAAAAAAAVAAPRTVSGGFTTGGGGGSPRDSGRKKGCSLVTRGGCPLELKQTSHGVSGCPVQDSARARAGVINLGPISGAVSG